MLLLRRGRWHGVSAAMAVCVLVRGAGLEQLAPLAACPGEHSHVALRCAAPRRNRPHDRGPPAPPLPRTHSPTHTSWQWAGWRQRRWWRRPCSVRTRRRAPGAGLALCTFLASSSPRSPSHAHRQGEARGAARHNTPRAAPLCSPRRTRARLGQRDPSRRRVLLRGAGSAGRSSTSGVTWRLRTRVPVHARAPSCRASARTASPARSSVLDRAPGSLQVGHGRLSGSRHARRYARCSTTTSPGAAARRREVVSGLAVGTTPCARSSTAPAQASSAQAMCRHSAHVHTRTPPAAGRASSRFAPAPRSRRRSTGRGPSRWRAAA